MAQSFTQKLIEIDVALAPDPETNQPRQFDNGNNSVTLTGRASVRVQLSGAPVGSTAQVLVWGLTPSLMNQLSTLGLVFQLIPQNTLTIRAGDAVSGLATVFVGTIRSAIADFNRAPDVPFVFECVAGLLNQVIPAKASSYPGPVDAANVMQTLAGLMGYGFENNGVTAKLPASYFPGTVADQWKKVAQDAGIEANIVPGASGNQVLAIWPKGGSRSGTVPLVSPDTGMIGYPAYSQVGITVKTIFNPQIGFGGQIQIKSSLPRATGKWVVLRMDHALDSLLPEGAWETTLSCFNPNFAAKFGVPTVV